MNISIHALLAESDWSSPRVIMSTWKFLSTLSLRRATFTFLLPLALISQFLSTLSLRRATSGHPQTHQRDAISIHALLAESDLWVLTGGSNCEYFYPRSPCGERQSQPPCARPTKDFYPRSPCGERHTSKDIVKTARNFYPRSPCGERQCRL